MSEARQQILEALRASSPRAPAVERETAAPRPAIPGDPLEAFSERLKAVAGECTVASDEKALGALVAEYLARHQLAPELAAAAHPLLDRVEWPAHLVLHRRPATGTDRASLTVAFAGVAETGSLVMVSRADTPTTLNFLPEHCLIVLEHRRLVRNLEDVWPLLRSLGPKPPRAVNFITGPSRTADVEQTIQLGAHGPRFLRVFFLQQPNR